MLTHLSSFCFQFHVTLYFNTYTTHAVFFQANVFNGDLSQWYVGAVTDMSGSKYYSKHGSFFNRNSFFDTEE